MDVAYDHIQEESLPQEPKKSSDQTTDSKDGKTDPPAQTLNAEIAEAYKSISTTPWGAKLGGFFSTVQKQSTTLYDGARQEATTASGEAFKGFQDLRASLASRARSLSSADKPPAPDSTEEGTEKEGAPASSESKSAAETEGMVSRFRSEAAKRLKDLEKAEEAADAAILRFGSNLGNFLKDAVTVTAPSDDESGKDAKGKVLFESKGEDGKRVIHSTRLEAQLHAIHTSSEKFLKDPDLEGKGEGKDEWENWKEGFDAEGRTEDIKRDLERYEELRKMMERLVPEKVEYKEFWCRYYFLRDLVEKEEQRRREVLKGKLCPSPPQMAWSIGDLCFCLVLHMHRRSNAGLLRSLLGRRLRR